MKRSGIGFAAVALGCVLAVGCHSAHVEVTVENRTGAEVRLLEVDYPEASFGADSIAMGNDMHYRIQLTGTGPVKVQYTAPNKSQPQAAGPEMHQGQEGRLTIVLLPGGKAEFHPELHGGK
ncbi:MAG TPA: hypothetical protein VG225_02465 [Terracidiphilus sp.]|jgi:hypothetical protein|nr:hypothetical protein [Terracidiphilus sp.]